MKRTVLSTFFAIILAVCAFSSTAKAETSGIWEYYTNYNFDLPGDMEVTITDCTGSGSITVPAKIGGYYVTSFVVDFYNKEDITSITFASNPYLEYVSDFYGCSNLRSLYMSNVSIDELCDNFLYGCDKLTTFTWPKGVTKIGEVAFGGCSSLTSLTIPSTVTEIEDSSSYGYGAFADCTSLRSIDMSNCKITKLPDQAFWDCTALTTVKLPSTLKTIGESAFRNCSALKSISIPDTVTTIDQYAFSGCESLEAITLPASLTTLGECALKSCSAIKSIHLPKNFYSFGSNVFDGMENLATITVDPENRYFTVSDNVLYNKSKTKLVYYPQGLPYAEKFYIPVGVTTIGKYAFPTSFNYNNVFYGYGTIRNIYVPHTVTHIETYGIAYYSGNIYFCGDKPTFEDYSVGSSSVKLYYTPDRMGWDSYLASKKTLWPDEQHASIWVRDGLPTCGDGGYDVYRCERCDYTYNKADGTVPTGKHDYTYSADGNVITERCVACNHNVAATLSIDPDMVLSYTGEAIEPAIISYDERWSSAKEVIVSYENNISAGTATAFAKLAGVTAAVTFTIEKATPIYVEPSGLTAEYGDALGSISLPNGWTWQNPSADVGEIGTNSFIAVFTPSDTDNYYTVTRELSITVTAPATSGSCGENVTWAFDETTGTLTISGTGAMYGYSIGRPPWYDYRSQLTKVIIEEGVTNIGEYSFSNCSSITTVSISSSVTKIDNRAFSYCRGLSSITIPGTVKWIGPGAFINCSGLTIVEFGEGVEEISLYAFMGCSQLSSAVIPKTVTEINTGIFANCDSMQTIEIDKENPNYYCDANGVLFKKNPTTLLIFPAGSSLKTYSVPEGVTSIAVAAFYGCEGLTTVEIPESVDIIAEDAFRSCSSLESVMIKGDVSIIVDNAFRSCTKLREATFCGNAPESFGYNVFTSTAPDFTIYYHEGTTGWGDGDTWNGYKLVMIPKPTIPGDVNGDGEFNYYDVSKLYAYFRGNTTLDDGAVIDINGDGEFNYYDVSKLYAIFRGNASFN